MINYRNNSMNIKEYERKELGRALIRGIALPSPICSFENCRRTAQHNVLISAYPFSWSYVIYHHQKSLDPTGILSARLSGLHAGEAGMTKPHITAEGHIRLEKAGIRAWRTPATK